MKSFRELAFQPGSLPIAADEILEFHAARLILLLKVCSAHGMIDSLTKIAKLDFFVRYPQFFEQAALEENKPVEASGLPEDVESSMIRLHYGPWDPRYYQLLPYLEARGLIDTSKHGNAYNFSLTAKGDALADQLLQASAFEPLITHMQSVYRVLGKKSGSQLKTLIYKLFDKEVAKRPLGEVIE